MGEERPGADGESVLRQELARELLQSGQGSLVDLGFAAGISFKQRGNVAGESLNPGGDALGP
jgi:hypothetical protein